MKRYILSLVAACGCSFILTNHTDIDTSEPNIYRKGKTSTSPYDEILQIIGRVCDADTYGKCLLLLNDTPLPQETQYRTIEILANTLEAYEDELSELTITHIFNKLKQKSEELHSSYPTNTLLAQHAQKPSETVDETKRRISREQEAGAFDTANTPTGQSHELQELIPQEKKDATDPPLPSAEPKHEHLSTKTPTYSPGTKVQFNNGNITGANEIYANKLQGGNNGLTFEYDPNGTGDQSFNILSNGTPVITIDDSTSTVKIHDRNLDLGENTITNIGDIGMQNTEDVPLNYDTNGSDGTADEGFEIQENGTTVLRADKDAVQIHNRPLDLNSNSIIDGTGSITLGSNVNANGNTIDNLSSITGQTDSTVTISTTTTNDASTQTADIKLNAGTSNSNDTSHIILSGGASGSGSGNVQVTAGNFDIQTGTIENSTGALTVQTSSGNLTLNPNSDIDANSNIVTNVSTVQGDGSSPLVLDGDTQDVDISSVLNLRSNNINNISEATATTVSVGTIDNDGSTIAFGDNLDVSGNSIDNLSTLTGQSSSDGQTLTVSKTSSGTGEDVANLIIAASTAASGDIANIVLSGGTSGSGSGDVQVAAGDLDVQSGTITNSTSNNLTIQAGSQDVTLGSRLDLNSNNLTDTSTSDLTITKSTESNGSDDTKTIIINAVESEIDADTGGSGDTANVKINLGANNGNLIAANLKSGAGTAVVIDSNGNILEESSTKQVKRDITPCTETMADHVLNLQPVSFYRTSGSNRKEYGLIAEDVEQYIPELVTYKNDGITPRGVMYQRVGPLVLTAVQKQQKHIENHNTEIERLHTIVEQQSQEIRELYAKIDELLAHMQS